MLKEMIVATAILIFLLLIFMPVRFCIDANFNFTDMTASVNLKVFLHTLVKENIFYGDGQICYKGTVDGQFQGDRNSRQNATDIAKCITIDSIFLFLQNDFSNQFFTNFVLQNTLINLLSQLVCTFSHCQFGVVCNSFSNIDSLQIVLKGNVSIAGLSSCFIKQEVQKCKQKFLKLSKAQSQI